MEREKVTSYLENFHQNHLIWTVQIDLVSTIYEVGNLVDDFV